MIAKWAVIICAAVITLSPKRATSQIPAVCTDADSLRNLECCPDNCGAASGRGACSNIGLSHSMTSRDVRANWPHYFTRACSCTGNYGGYDCSRCKYGYYGADCSQKQVLQRESIHELSDQQWRDYINVLRMARNYPSGYKVVLDESVPGTTSINAVDINLYNLFVWLHHFAAKDNDLCQATDPCIKVDYAHEATGFPTWHRQYMLWFEWEIQWMLQNMGDPNYQNFRIHYWDWQREDRAEEIFEMNRLGVARDNGNDQYQVYGDLFGDRWSTICWYRGSGGINTMIGTICDPRIDTGPLLRCPILPDGTSPCRSSNPNWPGRTEVNTALGIRTYDTTPYNTDITGNSFRNFMEGFDIVEINQCRANDLCQCEVGGINCDEGNPSKPLQRHLHNSIHIIVGIGKFGHGLNENQKGVMGDVAASPNDPIFVNHHGMIDCILEEWLQRNSRATYPDDVPSEPKGHQRNGAIVPFFPVVKHNDIFQTADNFGYSCRLTDPTVGPIPPRPPTPKSAAVLPNPPTCVLLVGALLCLASSMNI